MKYDYVTDEQMADFNQYPCPTAGCTSCSIAAELASRRPNDQERMQLADLLGVVRSIPHLAQHIRHALEYIERQLEMSK